MSSVKHSPDLTATITKESFQQLNQLPQSYLIATQIMKQSILKQVYLQIYNKKLKEKDHNFDGYLKQLQSSGTIEIPLVTFGVDVEKLMVFGDRMGGVYLYDINKKMILSRKQISTGHRIVHIATEMCPIGDAFVVTIAVIARGDPNVYILRYKSNQQKLYLNYQIQISTVESQAGNDISDYPYEVKLSKYGLLAAVALRNGSVNIYSIPEIKNVQIKQQSNKKITSSSNGSISPIQLVLLQQSSIKLINPDCTIPFQGIQKRKTYKQMVQSMKKPKIQPVVVVQEKKKEPATKNKDLKAQPIVEVKNQEQKPLLKQYNDPTICPLTVIQQSKDYTQNTPDLKFKPYFYFLNQSIVVSGAKQFSAIKSVYVTTKFSICWTNTIIYSVYSLRKANNNNIPSHLYLKLFQSERNIQKDLIRLELLQQTKTIYPITCSTASIDLTLLALGLKDGTVQIWDINNGVLKYNFDKHPKAVKCLSFFQIFKLVSGGQDGSVMIHDLQTNQTAVKRTNIFQSKIPYSILQIKISDIGVAFIIDSLGNLKVYDLWRNQKVGVLIASPPQRLTNKFKKWNIDTPTLVIMNDYFVILSDNLSEDQPIGSKSTVLQTFKIFESLLNIFDALSIIYRKGIDRQKVLNIFSNLEMSQLYQKTFQLPQSTRFKKQLNGNNLQIISEVPVSRNTSSVSKKKPTHNEQQYLQPEIKMFSRKRTPKMNIPNQQWLMNTIRQQHNKKQIRQHKLLGVTSKTQHSFNT